MLIAIGLFVFLVWHSDSPFTPPDIAVVVRNSPAPRANEADDQAPAPMSARGWWMVQMPNGQHKEIHQLFDDLDAHETGE